MRKIREVLRLAFFAGLELRKIERSLSISHATAASYVAKAEAAGLSWPLPDHLDDTALERLFFPKPAACAASRPAPDWEYVHGELRKKGVTRILLWQEYKETYPDGYQLAQFYELYNCWRGKIDLVMRQALWDRFEFVYTPKHGSWLNMAEIELNVLIKQCLDRRIDNMIEMQAEVEAWQKRRDNMHSTINWQFRSEDARIKLKRLYPTLGA